MLQPGVEVLVTEGPFNGFRGVVREVGAEDVLVDVLMFGRGVPTRFRAGQLSAPEMPAGDGPFRPGDVVHVHDGLSRGFTGVVESIAPEEHLLVKPAGGEVMPRRFDEVTLVSPLRGSPLDQYEAAIRRAVARRGYSLRRRQWWVERAREREWTDEELPGLATRFLDLERTLDEARDATAARAVADLRSEYESLDAEQQVARWITDHERWTTWRPEMSATHREIAEKIVTPEEVAERVRVRGDAATDEDARRRAFDDLVEEEMSRGGELAGRVEGAGLLP